MHPLDDTLAIALPATYVVSISALVIEGVILRWIGHRADLRSVAASLLSGAGTFGFLALANQVFFVGFMHVFWEHRFVDLGLGPSAWLVAFIVYDFCFYATHRAGHEVRLLWCFHSVHHTTEEMLLTTAIRGSVLDFLYAPWFFVWIPLLGVHPALVLVVEVFARFWGVATHISPRLVGRLGLLDRWLVTPSVHRVHHGRNLPYLDRNYGEVLLLWDRLFGTWRAEGEAPDYGLLSPVDAGSFVDVQISPWKALVADIRRAPTWGDKFRYCLFAPGWSHDGPDRRVKALQAVK